MLLVILNYLDWGGNRITEKVRKSCNIFSLYIFPCNFTSLEAGRKESRLLYSWEIKKKVFRKSTCIQRRSDTTWGPHIYITKNFFFLEKPHVKKSVNINRSYCNLKPSYMEKESSFNFYVVKSEELFFQASTTNFFCIFFINSAS